MLREAETIDQKALAGWWPNSSEPYFQATLNALLMPALTGWGVSVVTFCTRAARSLV
jgi:hypothetical protein